MQVNVLDERSGRLRGRASKQAANARNAPGGCTVDWRAALWAGLAASVGSFALYLLLVPVAGGAGSAELVLRFMASVLLGPDVLVPTTALSALPVASAVFVHFGLSLAMAAVIAFVLHRWGLLAGIGGGALMGLMFFGINYYTLTAWQPQFHVLAHWSVAVVHVVFGALAGGVYEWLELEPWERSALPERKV